MSTEHLLLLTALLSALVLASVSPIDAVVSELAELGTKSSEGGSSDWAAITGLGELEEVVNMTSIPLSPVDVTMKPQPGPSDSFASSSSSASAGPNESTAVQPVLTGLPPSPVGVTVEPPPSPSDSFASHSSSASTSESTKVHLVLGESGEPLKPINALEASDPALPVVLSPVEPHRDEDSGRSHASAGNGGNVPASVDLAETPIAVRAEPPSPAAKAELPSSAATAESPSLTVKAESSSPVVSLPVTTTTARMNPAVQSRSALAPKAPHRAVPAPRPGFTMAALVEHRFMLAILLVLLFMTLSSFLGGSPTAAETLTSPQITEL